MNHSNLKKFSLNFSLLFCVGKCEISVKYLKFSISQGFDDLVRRNSWYADIFKYASGAS